MSSESSKALRAMASSIEKMAHPKIVDIHVENAKQAAKELENVLNITLYGPENILVLVPDATVASILVNITNCVENISEAVHELAKQANFKEVEATVSPEMTKSTAKLHRGIVNPMYDDGDRDVVDRVDVIICDQKPQNHKSCCTEEEINLGVAKKCSDVNKSTTVSLPPIITCM